VKIRTLQSLLALGTTAMTTMAVAQNERTTPMLDQGTQELSVAGTLDLPELDELDYDIDGSYGYFLRDGWEVGVELSASDFDGADRVEIGGFTEMNFRRNRTIVPYVGAGIGLVSADFGDEVVLGTPIDDEDGLVFDVEGGAKFFLQPYMAISLAIDFKFSTEDVFETGEEIEDNLSSIKVGMRYYF
jgi:hypothetical protein